MQRGCLPDLVYDRTERLLGIVPRSADGSIELWHLRHGLSVGYGVCGGQLPDDVRRVAVQLRRGVPRSADGQAQLRHVRHGVRGRFDLHGGRVHGLVQRGYE
jgi:hypothetical protein